MLNDDEFKYICGLLMKSDLSVLFGCVSNKIEAFTAGIGLIQGKEPDIYGMEHTLTEAATNEAGYKYDNNLLFSTELY